MDAALEVWIGERTEAEVLEAFESVHSAAASVYDMADIAGGQTWVGAGSHRRRRRHTHAGLIARLSATPGAIRWAGRALDADGNAIRDELTVD